MSMGIAVVLSILCFLNVSLRAFGTVAFLGGVSELLLLHVLCVTLLVRFMFCARNHAGSDTGKQQAGMPQRQQSWAFIPLSRIHRRENSFSISSRPSSI